MLVYYSIYVYTLMYIYIYIWVVFVPAYIYIYVYIYIYIYVHYARIDIKAIHIPMLLCGFPTYEHPNSTHIIAFAMNIVAFTVDQHADNNRYHRFCDECHSFYDRLAYRHYSYHCYHNKYCCFS